jgi:hypothetical protein
MLVITLFACAPCNSLVTFCYSLSFCCASSPCYSSHLVDIVVALMNYSFHLVHHHLTIRHCLALSLPCVVYCHLMFLIVALCCLPLLCCHHHCIVITIITSLFVLPSVNTTSTPHLIVAHCHIAICLTPYCGDGISPLLSMCKLLIVCALCIVEVSTKATFTFQKLNFFSFWFFGFVFVVYVKGNIKLFFFNKLDGGFG